MTLLMEYLQYPFVRYALIVGVLIALCSSLLGVTLVLKRFSFIGDGLSHVAFGAIAIASVLKLENDMLFVLPATVLCAILLLRVGQNAKIKGDAAIAMLSVGALAIGYLLMNLFSTSTNLSGDVCSTLFGSTSILTLTRQEVWLCVALSVVVVAVFAVFYHKIFAVTFDETFARASGTKVGAYNLMIAVLMVVYYKTTFGTHVRLVGDNWEAAEAIGINVQKVKIAALVISGLCCALAGLNISVESLGMYTLNISASRGYICLSAINCGRKEPGKSALFGLLFGFTKAVQIVLSNYLGSTLASLLEALPYITIIVVLVATELPAVRRNPMRIFMKG